MLYDMMQKYPFQRYTYKEFLAWFLIRRNFKYTKATGFDYTIPLKRAIKGF